MTIYQEEMQRKAQRYGCITDYDEADQLLLISHKGVHLTAVNPEGFMFYNSKELTDPESREVFSHLVDDAETVREYVGLYESSPQMKPKDVQNYRKLSEYGDVVFAGMYSQKHGFMFCSWRQSDGGKYLAHRIRRGQSLCRTRSRRPRGAVCREEGDHGRYHQEISSRLDRQG